MNKWKGFRPSNSFVPFSSESVVYKNTHNIHYVKTTTTKWLKSSLNHMFVKYLMNSFIFKIFKTMFYLIILYVLSDFWLPK